jgi:hypothetical protein
MGIVYNKRDGNIAHIMHYDSDDISNEFEKEAQKLGSEDTGTPESELASFTISGNLEAIDYMVDLKEKKLKPKDPKS